MNQDSLEKYARLILKTGLNLRKNQTLLINSPIECAPITRLIAEVALREGARDVKIVWNDELFAKIRFTYAAEEVFDEFPDWQKDMYMSYLRRGAAILSIAANDPELMKDVDPVRMMKAQKASSTGMKEYREQLMSNRNVWCIISIPTASWAKKVFPQLTEVEGIEELWKAILKTVRVDQADPIEAWKIHKINLKQRMDYLNAQGLKSLHYQNSLGTDLTIELPDGHLWLGGSEFTPDGIEFVANMPTEEVFTLPKKTGVVGKAVSSMPLNYNGSLIEDFSLTFKEGRIIDYSAEKGYESLKSLIETDEGSHYLGEVALVPYDSPISNSKIMFYNTLFDENASCHLAIGKAYPVCLKGGDALCSEELEKEGVNDSLLHEDFMIGTADLEITGVTKDGREISIFEKGNFVIA
ncbi:aminopeptidase [Desulfitobacterium sp.]|uniref:aminopeptidase n=1 Tax=Desulfitobacterium sp. TaxID=49981 RepID=UPI002C8EDC91|nr:aminopeptidase [Desulfitobacterium sp.]HVJ48520.1 aminopeptidase [Desulfitobacterium sp.]